jgi:hypothetical protein
MRTEEIAAHRLANIINRAGRVKAFVQANGNLRIVARSCAAARVELGRAGNATGINETALNTFEVRLTGTKTVLTYPVAYDPMRTDIDHRTGALL